MVNYSILILANNCHSVFLTNAELNWYLPPNVYRTLRAHFIYI